MGNINSEQLSLLEQQLAESQAREKVLLSALDEIGALNLAAKLSPVITTILREALAHTSDDTALKAALAAERERYIKAIQEIANCVEYDGDTADECIQQIRALGD